MVMRGQNLRENIEKRLQKIQIFMLTFDQQDLENL